MLKKAILVDIDGTLADIEHRVHHVQKKVKDWKSFSAEMPADKLNQWCFELMGAMKKESYEIILVTGRGESSRDTTIEWLKENLISYDQLYMRDKSDHRDDFIIKREIFNNHIKDKYQVLFVIEDRASVVKMWRELGLVCLHCDWGDF